MHDDTLVRTHSTCNWGCMGCSFGIYSTYDSSLMKLPGTLGLAAILNRIPRSLGAEDTTQSSEEDEELFKAYSPAPFPKSDDQWFVGIWFIIPFGELRLRGCQASSMAQLALTSICCLICRRLCSLFSPSCQWKWWVFALQSKATNNVVGGHFIM